MAVQTTDQGEVNRDVSSSDAKEMQTKYVKGATIDDLAVEYGYDSAQVEASVVTPAPEDPENKTQAELDKESNQPAPESKKAK